MIIATNTAPPSVLCTAILASLRKHAPVDGEHIIVLVPALPVGLPRFNQHKVLLADSFQIALDLRGPVTKSSALLDLPEETVSLLQEFVPLRDRIRVPFTVFTHSDQFRVNNDDTLKTGDGASKLIKAYTGV